MKKEKRIRPFSRRDFLKAGALATGFFIVPRFVLGRGFTAPSDKINLGFVGCGKQSLTLRPNFIKEEQAQFVAACDVYQAKLERFVQAVNAFYAQKTGQPAYKGCDAYHDLRELLERKDIDAVIIATPDHWHSVAAIKACEAGKDVYCEKPLALTIAEGRAMVTAARTHDRVFQTGSMQRSWKEFRQAVELVRNGYIGPVNTVKVNVGGPPKDWDLHKEPLPEGMDWDFWMGPNKTHRPYNHILAPTIAGEPSIWPKWRDYHEFGGGMMTDWGAHLFDIAQWGLDMDSTGPVKITPPEDGSGSGLVYEYANGIRLLHAPEPGPQSCRFIGSEGDVWVARGQLKTNPESLKDKIIGEQEKHVYFSDNHYTDFLKAIRSRQKPICDVETGHRTASICNLGNIAYSLKRPLAWDPVAEKFLHDKKANKRLGRSMRKEWNIL